MITLIRSTSKNGAFLIIIFGAIASLWANCLFITNLKNEMRSEMFVSEGYDEYNLFIWTIQFTYLCIFIIGSGTLISAFKNSCKFYLIPWSLLKFCENIVLVVGSCTLYFKWKFSGLVPLGVISFVLNVYISLSVYKAFRKMAAVQSIKDIENDLNGIIKDGNCQKLDKASQTEATNITIEIKKTSNNEIRQNKENPLNYVHTTPIPNEN